jgi:signal transduction histidine kinase
MADFSIRIRRKLKAAHRTFRELKMIAKGLFSTDHPIQVHIIPMRRCNLSCAYCNEYDDFSDPVPLEEMYRRIDKLAALGTFSAGIAHEFNNLLAGILGYAQLGLLSDDISEKNEALDVVRKHLHSERPTVALKAAELLIKT